MEPSSTTPPPPVPSQGRAHHPQLHAQIPNSSTTSLQHWTASSTPMSSPGLFSPTNPRAKMSLPVHAATDCNTPAGELNSPFLHPLQNHKVRETHKALVDLDFLTGRKLINQYEVIEEIGRGVHGKVKLARNTGSGENVAIKIIPRFSKKRRLGKVMALSPQDKTKREIAILKKIRHPNVVALLEVIDDPELKKIYMVLEHVELGEVVWRKKGLPHICAYERRRVEKEMRGEITSAEEETYDRLLGQRQGLKDLKRAKMSQSSAGPTDFWSIEYGAAEDDDSENRSRISSKDNLAALEGPSSTQASRATSRAPSRTHSVRSVRSWGLTAHHIDNEHWNAESGSEIDTPGPLRSGPGSSAALDGTMYGPYVDESAFRGRSPSMADSIISHMSSIDYSSLTQDPYQDDYSYVPCFTFEQARTTFRDTVLGLEYLHYQGVVHRDIKPANLLWTKDHRVKISDFGVSYFGRPIRDSEAEDGMSESEALDFDDDLELSKTVGTPAFFAPELCYTDMDWEQPRISEQIDVWSLGVTLYCLIFARIPFIAADEFQMFKKIATEDVYLPTRRLRPVDPSTPPNSTSLFKRQNKDPYRDDNALEYEDIPQALHDLLKKMLIKNPEKRIRLRDIKRHPWVTEGIENLIGWLDDTDPARPSSGRRIQVNEKEMSHAVVPITFLERARSAMKKAVGKVIHPLGERAESKSRRRAASSVASSAGDSMQNAPHTPHPRDARRRSLRGDDYFTGLTSEQHPLTQSLVPSPVEGEFPRADPMATAILRPLSMTSDFQLRSKEADRSDRQATDVDALPSPQPLRPFQRHSHARSMGHHTFLPLTPSMPESQTMPPTPSYDGAMDDPHDAIRKSRDMQASSDDGRARSVDRGLFGSTDKRAQPKVGLSTAVAPGNVAVPKHKRTIQSIDLSKASAKVTESGLPSPLLFSHRAISGYQHAYPNSDPNIHQRQQRVSSELDERPQTAHRVETVTDPRALPARSEKSATPDFFFRGTRMSFHPRENESRPASRSAVVNPADVPCPPSPGDEGFPAQPQPPSREDTIGTGKSNSLASFAGLETPLTSPSEVTSPTSTHGFAGSKANSQQMLAFQSDPSLPALLSGASSVSNDMESELLGQPGIVSTRTALLETTDSLTPPAMTKEPIAGYPLEQALEATSSMDSGIVPLELDQYNAQAAHQKSPLRSPEPRAPADEDDDDSDSDGGLQMVKTKRKKMPLDTHGGHRTLFTARRRDTNASIGSTETAKKVGMQGE